MRLIRRLGQILTRERVLWILALSTVAVAFFYIGQAYAKPEAPMLTPVLSDQPTTAATTESTTAATAFSAASTVSTIPAVSMNSAVTTTTAATTLSHSGERGGMLNLNTATKEQLMTINGIGETFADRIIAYRDSHGGFQSVEELRNISGIGEKRYNKWSAYFTVS